LQHHHYYYICLTASFCSTTWVGWYQKGKTSLGLNEAKVDGVFFGSSGISWTIHIHTNLYSAKNHEKESEVLEILVIFW